MSFYLDTTFITSIYYMYTLKKKKNRFKFLFIITIYQYTVNYRVLFEQKGKEKT